MSSTITGRHRGKDWTKWIVLVVLLSGLVTNQWRLSSSVSHTSSSSNVAVGFSTKVRSSKSQWNTTDDIGWWTPYLESTSRVFLPWNGTSPYGWCQPINKSTLHYTAPNDNSKISGLLYMKSYKASSSTCEGVNMAIAHHVGSRLFSNAKCAHYNRHEFANEKQHSRRDVASSLLWSFVRHPVKRDVSQVFHFRVSRNGVSPNDTNTLLPALRAQQSLQTQYLALPQRSTSRHPTTQKHQQQSAEITKIFQYYDFIGVTERMEESLAVMTLLWDLDPTDVIVLGSKRSGADYDAGGKKHKCTRILSAYPLHPDLANFLKSSEYRQNHADFLLYYTAHYSLDQTIQALGYERVQQRARLIQKLQLLAETLCRDQALFPCTNGTYQVHSYKNCYIQDAGCGYPCVDRILHGYQKGVIPLG